MTKLSDLFVPKWRHSDPILRAESIPNIDDLAILMDLAENDPSEMVRKSAVYHLEHENILERIALKDENPEVRSVAIGKLRKDSTLARIVFNDPVYSNKIYALEKIRSDEALSEICLHHPNKFVASLALKAIKDPILATELRIKTSDKVYSNGQETIEETAQKEKQKSTVTAESFDFPKLEFDPDVPVHSTSLPQGKVFTLIKNEPEPDEKQVQSEEPSLSEAPESTKEEPKFEIPEPKTESAPKEEITPPIEAAHSKPEDEEEVTYSMLMLEEDMDNAQALVWKISNPARLTMIALFHPNTQVKITAVQRIRSEEKLKQLSGRKLEEEVLTAIKKQIDLLPLIDKKAEDQPENTDIELNHTEQITEPATTPEIETPAPTENRISAIPQPEFPVKPVSNVSSATQNFGNGVSSDAYAYVKENLLHSIREGKLNDQFVLKNLVLNERDEEIKTAALWRISDQAVLMEILRYPMEIYLKKLALKRITNPSLLRVIVMESDLNKRIKLAAIRRIEDVELLVSITLKHEDPEIADAALESISCQKTLSELACGDFNENLRFSALLCIQDARYLAEVAACATSYPIREMASERLFNVAKGVETSAV